MGILIVRLSGLYVFFIEGASWFDPSHQAAAAAAAAAANHHLDPYHLEFGPRYVS